MSQGNCFFTWSHFVLHKVSENCSTLGSWRTVYFIDHLSLMLIWCCIMLILWLYYISSVIQLSSVQSLSHVQLFATPWTATHQASLSITNSWSPPKPMSIESMMPSNHLILCRPSPPALNPSQHQGLFQWFSSQHQVGQVLEFQLQHQSLVLDFKCCPLDFNDFLYCMFISLHFLSLLLFLFTFHLTCSFF